MIRFKSFLLEYLTDGQRKRFADVKMTEKARADTDHFFGKDNDVIHSSISNDAGHMEDKSEIHKKVESHLGKELSHEEYRSGLTKDKYGRDVKIGRVIKDPSLRNEFASDTAREGSKKGDTFTTSTVRGTEVAGQTNPVRNAQHPKGHSWSDISCKNVKDGVNKRYLKPEIQHGTVVHFVHDPNGQEIYRATLQPHHNEQGDVAYSVDAEYGIKHPAFTKSAHEAAKKLSGEYKSGVFEKHPKVYDDSDESTMLHPRSTPEHIDKALSDGHWKIREAAANHPNATAEHINKALDDREWVVRSAAAKHPNATAKHINKALDDENYSVRSSAIENPNATSENISKALDDKKYYSIRSIAAEHPNATADHINKALDDNDALVRRAAARNPKATAEHINKALDDKDDMVRAYAIGHPNATAGHITKALNDESSMVRSAAIHHPNATAEHISKALNDEVYSVRRAAINHPNTTPEHINKALDDSSVEIRRAAIRHPNATAENITTALNNGSEYVREAAVLHPNATAEHITKALNDEKLDVRKAARERKQQLRI